MFKPYSMNRIKENIAHFWHFASEDIWRITETEVSGSRRILINLFKTVIISVRRFKEDDLQAKASALTYNMMLAIVPMLALMYAIARGFGFQNIIQMQLLDYFPAQRNALTYIFDFVKTYLSETRNGGVFVGAGILMLLWTVVSMVNNIEAVFNEIWQVKKARSFYRKITDYTSFFLILPILMIASGGMSLFLSSSFENLDYLSFMSPVVRKLLSFSPYFLTWLFFTGMYVLIPNTRVKFWNALLAGIICGTFFQFFQFIYINGQIWVSKYNAVYGGLAFLPLLLLWIQLSWIICLFGAVLTFSAQNIRNYNFERDTKNISRRYKDFLLLLVASLIVQRFVKGEKPLTVEEISYDNKIPIKLTGQLLYLLTEIGVIVETVTDEDRVTAYQPAMDVNKLSVGELFSRVDLYGSEKFKIDNRIKFGKQWKTLLITREKMLEEVGNVLLKDLVTEKKPENKK